MGMPRTIKLDLYDGAGKRQKDPLWQKRVYHGEVREEKRLFRLLDRLLRLPKAYPEHSDYRGLGSAASRQQLCIVKARIGKDRQAHIKFLKEYLPQENKKQVLEKPALFGAGDGADAVSEYERHMTGKHFKFIISPENQRVDTEALVRTLVKRMEAATGYRFRWLAAAHTDTAHKHAHLLINGRDRKGNDVFFEKTFIKQTMREMSRQICTSLIGPRSREEIQQARTQLYKAKRYTALDDAIADRERPYTGESPRYESRADGQEESVYKRLAFLASIGLAEQDGKNKKRFYLERNWKSKLKTLGRYNSYLDARRSLVFSSDYNLEQYTGSEVIEGKITKLYRMNDEDSWNHALLVENKKERRAWYVPLYFEPDDRFMGSTVRISAQKNENGLLRPKLAVLKWEQNGITK
jgi:hypothetical protein